MTRRLLSAFCLPAAVGALLSLSGCAGNGYITSSVGTVVGLDVSENPTTQVPHLRFGYVRSGVYYVPTGKTEAKSGPTGSGDASDTPTVVSEIFVHSKFITDIVISEKFAIGPGAVSSTAAAASFSNPAAQAVANPNANLSTATPTIVETQTSELSTAQIAALRRTARDEARVATSEEFERKIREGKDEENLEEERKQLGNKLETIESRADKDAIYQKAIDIGKAQGGKTNRTGANGVLDVWNSIKRDKEKRKAVFNALE